MNKIKVGIVFLFNKNFDSIFSINKILLDYHFIYLDSIPEKDTNFIFHVFNNKGEKTLCSNTLLKKICIPQSNSNSYSQFKFYKPDTEIYLIFESFKQYTLDKSHYPILDSHILSL